jgi:hypothetical protein
VLWAFAALCFVAGGALSLASLAGMISLKVHIGVVIMSMATPLIALAEQSRPKPPSKGSGAARRKGELTGSARPG